MSPAPSHALGQRGTRDVLDTLHQFDQPLLAARAYRGEADAAVAGDDCRHAVTAGRLQQVVPSGLTVVVGVNVHETGRHDPIRRVDRLGGYSGKLIVAVGPSAYFDDLAVFDADIGPIAVRAGA